LLHVARSVSCQTMDYGQGTMLSIRQATIADREELIGPLSKGVYDGNDYFPARVDRYFADQTRGTKHMLVACDATSQKILGLDVVCLYDDGETVMLQALRVRPEARGRGVAKALSEAVDAYVARVLLPTLHPPRRIRVITSGTNPSIGLFEKRGFRRMQRYGLCGASISAGSWESSGHQHELERPRAHGDKISQLREMHFRAEDEGDILQYLPRDNPYLLFDWLVELPTVAALERLESTGVRFFVRGDRSVKQNNNVQDRDAQPVSPSLSFGGYTDWIDGTQLYCTVFCAGDMFAFCDHVRCWVRCAVGGARPISKLVFFYDRSLDFPQTEGAATARNVVEEALGSYKDAWIPFFEEADGVVVMEKPF